MAAPAEENHVGNHVGFEDEEDDLEDTEDSDMEEYEDDFAATPVPVVSINPNPNPPLGQHNGSIIVQPLSSSSADPKESKPPVTPAPARPAPAALASASASLDESRRLFQRLWTDDDEIKILNGFLEFTSSRGTTFASHQYDTGPFYEQIKNQLQLDFNKNQLIEKLRRLKKKYRNTAARMASHGKEFSFKSPHERATYEIARRIWSVGSSGVKRSRESDDDDLNPYSNNNNNSFDAAAATSERRTARSRRRGRKRALETIPVAPVPLMLPAPPIPAPPVLAGPSERVVKVEVQTTPTPIIPPMPYSSTAIPPPPPPPMPSIVEETVKGCLSPILKELLNSAVRGSVGSVLNGGVGFGIMGLGPPPVFSFGGNSAAGDEKWKKQQILELEVYLKRVELVRDQIKSTLEELKSSEPKAAAAVPTPAAAQTPTTGS